MARHHRLGRSVLSKMPPRYAGLRLPKRPPQKAQQVILLLTRDGARHWRFAVVGGIVPFAKRDEVKAALGR